MQQQSKVNFNNPSNYKHAIDLPDMTYTSHFCDGQSGVILRSDLPTLRFSAKLPIESVRKQVEQWNTFMQGSVDGTGSYKSDPNEDMANPEYHNFSIFCEDQFYKAFLESLDSTQDSDQSLDQQPSADDDIDLSFDPVEYHRILELN